MNGFFPNRRDLPPAGFTLAELLVASTIALMVMGGVASLMALFSRTATYSQAIVDMSSRMRNAASRLRQDLGGITVSVAPPLSPESASGYFEIVEGSMQDSLATTTLVADTDDALLFTTRSLSGPFEGRFSGTNQVESTTAEVAWFCRPSTTQPVQGVTLQTLYRRQLLVLGYVGASPFLTIGSATNNQVTGTLPTAYNTHDISLRSDPTVGNALVPNTLADLAQRENRFFHGPTFSTAFPNSATGLTFDSASGREGEDVVLTNVIAFDVRVFDPDAQPMLNGTTIVYPPEQTYTGPTAGMFKGCFVDLGRTPSAVTTLTSGAATKSGLTATYDTWTTAYESNGVDDDSDGIIDEGTNGVDNNGNNIPDDPAEDETAPPYATPLRAIEIRIRCYDPTSREIRQVTVRQAFSS